MTVMGILNATPDSFWAGSRFNADAAVQRGLELVSEGAQILDIGGESTRPGSAYVGVGEELARVLPVVEGLLAARCPVPLSVDTRKYEVMAAAAEAGASWLNDVSALSDARMGPFAAERGLTVVLMHRQGHPDSMQAAPHYDDVASEVIAYLSDRIKAALACGIRPENIVLDPGFGFGKTLEHTLDLFRALPRIRAMGFRVLVGISRKSFLGALTGASVDDRLAGSLAGALAAAEMGTDLIRVHDVAATVQALKVWGALGPRSRT